MRRDKEKEREKNSLHARANSSLASSLSSRNAAVDLQRKAGNQAVLELLHSGAVQAKLRVSQPGDADEQEADRAAEQTVSHRSAAGQQTKHTGEHPHSVIVEDDATSLGPGQMRKTEFVTLLQTTICATADAVLESVGHTTKGCPYIRKWLEHYKDKDAQHLTRVMHKYAPETARARSAHEAIDLLNQRVRRAALSWAKTGRVSDLPEGMQEELLGGGGLPGGGRTEGATGAKTIGSVQRKSTDASSSGDHDAATVKEQLRLGHPLDGRVQSQMSAAFGYDFSGVRVHTDAKASELSGQLNARAFTIGNDVAFAQGEYEPGTLIGDALIAHELAHVVQQGSVSTSGTPMLKGGADYDSAEADADASSVGVLAALWGAASLLRGFGTKVMPRLRTGLKLSRCKGKSEQAAFHVISHGVSQSTVALARERMTEILGGLKAENLSALGNVTVELHIIPADKRLTDLPEFSHLKGHRTFDGRLYDDLRGAGGTKEGSTIRYAIAEEQLVTVTGHPSGYAQGFVAGHETGHIVEQYALTADQSADLQKAFDARTQAHGPWLNPDWYTRSNRDEYFAQGAAAYFGHPYSSSDEDKRQYTREWLRTNDPALYRLLSQVFR